MRIHTTAFALLGSTLLAIATTAIAQEQATTNTTAAPASGSTHPSRGSTMSDVKTKFGAPTQESAAVGKPPITRWDYPGYVVYFENEKVLHTVVAK